MRDVGAALRLIALALALDAGHVVLAQGSSNVPSNATPAQPIDTIDTFAADFAAEIEAQNGNTAGIVELWSFIADPDNRHLANRAVLTALVRVSKTAKEREAMWTALRDAAADSETPGGKTERAATFPSMFERNRAYLLPLVTPGPETEAGGEALVDLIASSRIVADTADQAVRWIAARDPAALARRIERERGRDRPVKWEATAFAAFQEWRDRAFGAQAPKDADQFDIAAARFTEVVNSFHAFDDQFRRQLLRPLSAADLFDIAVGGETELYRMGTSTYREFMHDAIVRGITRHGSFESFLGTTVAGRDQSQHARLGPRAMIFLRIASSFGRIGPILALIADQPRFIDQALDQLADGAAVERNVALIADILTLRIDLPAFQKFRAVLLDRLYRRYDMATGSDKDRFGAILSVYQTLSGDRRITAIDRAYPIDEAILNVPFERLFSASGHNGHVHRMFVRFDDDLDGVASHASFRAVLAARGALVHADTDYDVYRIQRANRSIDIYANRPTASGVKKGPQAIAQALRGQRVHSVIGRGHTGILEPLQADARTILGPLLPDVALVIVGTCGGSASVRELITTFGYVPIVATRSTGRMVLNNALTDTLLTMLLNMPQSGTLSAPSVLDEALAPHLRGANVDLKDDAAFYNVNAANILAARLFDRHVRGVVALKPPTPDEAAPQRDHRVFARLTVQVARRASDERTVRSATAPASSASWSVPDVKH